MIAPTTKFSGGQELIAAFAALPAALAKGSVTAAMKSAVEPMIGDMKAGAPRRSGAGAASIDSAVTHVEGHGVTVAVGPDRDHFYMAFREWGTAKIPAIPYMRPAWDAHRESILAGLGAAIWAKLAATAAKLASKVGA